LKKNILVIVATFSVSMFCTQAFAKVASAPKNNLADTRNVASVDTRGFLFVSGSSCSPEEDKLHGSECEKFCFHDVFTEKTLKCVFGTSQESATRLHIVAILLGLGNAGSEVEQARSILESAEDLNSVNNALAKFIVKACDQGKYTVAYKKYVDVLEKQLKCSTLDKQ